MEKPELHIQSGKTSATKKDSTEIISPASLEIQSWTTRLIQGEGGVESPSRSSFSAPSAPHSQASNSNPINAFSYSILQDHQSSNFYYDPSSVDDYQNPITSSAPFFDPSSQNFNTPQDLYSFRDPNNLDQSPFESPIIDPSGHPSPLEAFRDRASSFGSDRSSNRSPSSIALGESPNYPSLFPNQNSDDDNSWMLNSLKQVGSMSIDDQANQFPPVFDEEPSSSSPMPPSVHNSSSFGSSQRMDHSPQVPVLAVSQPSMDVPHQSSGNLFQSSPNEWNTNTLVSEPAQMDIPSQSFAPHRPNGYQQIGESLAALDGRSPNKGSDYGSPQSAIHSSPQAVNNQPLPSGPPRRAPSRDDSYDRLKKFLGFSEIDVEGNQPTTIMGGVRKRSLSDVGPRPSEFFRKDQEIGKMLLGGNIGQGLPLMDSNDLSWLDEGMRDKFGHRGMNAISEAHFANPPPTTVMAMQHHNSSSPTSSTSSSLSTSPNAPGVDPSLLGGSSERQAPSIVDSSAPSNGFHISGGHYRHGSFGSSPMPNPSSWIGPPSGSAAGLSTSAPSNPRRGHKRGAQSEDLRSTANQEGLEDFLAQITAPNGGLAPPGAARSQIPSPVSSSTSPVPSGGGGGHGRGAGAPPFYPTTSNSSSNRPHPYRTSHDRHSSFGSNHSHSSSSLREELLASREYNPISIPSMLMPPHPAHSTSPTTSPGGTNAYSQTALPTYGGLEKEGSSPTTFVNAKVTTKRTQQASAMRRKNEAMYACPIAGCNSTFTRKYNLRGHIRSHQDERPFVCDFQGCGRAFSRVHDMKRHRNLHTNAKPFTCDVCGKTFARADALGRHQRLDSEACGIKLSENQRERRASTNSNGSANTTGSRNKNKKKDPDLQPNQNQNQNQNASKGFGGQVM